MKFSISVLKTLLATLDSMVLRVLEFEDHPGVRNVRHLQGHQRTVSSPCL
jgi:hypothetical protein